jgi:hypothetical protein
MIMPTPKIIQIEEDREVCRPVCNALIVDEDEGLVEQPSCPHIRFVYCNGEAFEHDPEGFEMRLEQARDQADEDGLCFEPFEWLLAQCGDEDVILEQVTDDVGCGSLRFRVWIGIRKTPRDSKSRRAPVVAASVEEYTCGDHRIFFEPTANFIRWMKAQFSGKLIYEVGCGVGNLSAALAKAGLRVTAIDLAPRSESEFDVIKADSTQFPFEKDSVVMFCRPSHSGFVEKTLTKAIQSHVSHILYVGLTKNLQDDLGSIHDRFTKRRAGAVGHSGEQVWELNVKRLRAEASVRRGIPRLSPYVLQ